jgi:1,4-alpha-glucan branching enzyme
MHTLTEFDLYLFGQGTLQRAYEKLGAHLDTVRNEAGVHFAVWAPGARAVSVIGDFDGWQAGKNQLSPTGSSGIWQGFVPGLERGETYKYAILPQQGGEWVYKADPYAFAAESRPATASRVADLDAYTWMDAAWMRRRAETDWSAAAVSMYEVHLGSWKRDPGDPRRFLTYRELAESLPAYLSEMGYTHLELLPVAEHPLDKSWGYQVTGYFAPTARFGPPEEFMLLVDRCHEAGIGVILDWVPAHFPKDAHGLAQFDGTHLYEHADPRQGEHPDWGTLIFNYGRHEVQSFLLSNAIFWMDKYHIDGLRVDAVASMIYLDYSKQSGQWVPNRFGGRENLEAIELLQQVNVAVHQNYPGALMIAEESTAWPLVTGPTEMGGLGFDLKWNMGWMHDTLRYLRRDPIFRSSHQGELTFSLVYAFSERFLLPLSHDEVVHGKGSLPNKMPGDEWQKFANLRLLLAYMFGHPGKKLLFMGIDVGQLREWNYAQSADWHLLELDGAQGDRHRGVHRLVGELNRLYSSNAALHALENPEGFQWIDFADEMHSVIAFLRRSTEAMDSLVFVCNFTPVVRYGYRVGLPSDGLYRELINTDALQYGGSGVVNSQEIMAKKLPYSDQPCSVEITLPPLGVIILQSG